MEHTFKLLVLLKLFCDGFALRIVWCHGHGLRGDFDVLQQRSLVECKYHSLLVVEQYLTHSLHTLRVARLVDNVQVTLNPALSFSEQAGDPLMFARQSLTRNKELVKAIDDRGLVKLSFLFIRFSGHAFHAQQRIHLFIVENLGLVSAPDERLLLLALALTFIDYGAYCVESRQQTSKVAHDRQIRAHSDLCSFLRSIQLEDQRKLLFLVLIELIDVLKVILRCFSLGDFVIAELALTDKDGEFTLVRELVFAYT